MLVLFIITGLAVTSSWAPADQKKKKIDIVNTFSGCEMAVGEFGVVDLRGTKSHLNYRPCASSGSRAKRQFFFHVVISPSSTGSLHCPGFKIELRHTHTR